MASTEAEFLAVTGRRRVGKTYLINEYFKEHICFRLMGIQDGDQEEQLAGFTLRLREYYEFAPDKSPQDWLYAFFELRKYLNTLPTDRKQVIFLDELPWMASSGGKFVQFLAHFWNDYLAQKTHFILVVCGSATSWIIQNIFGDPGGMHNRVTYRLHLHPFTLDETKAFLSSKGHRLTHQQITQTYMAMGGIPFYLRHFPPGIGFAAGINELIFHPSGRLSREYSHLYAALFHDSIVHEEIVSLLAKHREGLTHGQLSDMLSVSPSGKKLTETLQELVQSDFVAITVPFNRKKRGAIYRLIDEFSIFHHRFVKPMQTYTPQYWQQQVSTMAYKSWTGFAFEQLCLKHVAQIKQALGISGVFAPVSGLRIPADDDGDGVQIDLIIDRNDGVINLCEIKFHAGKFTITKEYHRNLMRKRWRFEEVTKTKKQVFLTMITNHPVKKNEWFLGTIDSTVILDDLFRPA